MSITDELRKEARGFSSFTYTPQQAEHLISIADSIDAEHQKAMDEWRAKHGQMWLKGYKECHAELLEGNKTLATDLECCGWVRLPRDADGEYIHIGDVMEWSDGETFEVVGIGDGVLFYAQNESHAEWASVSNKRHHKQPTVEDVLEEMYDALENARIPNGSEKRTYEEIIAEYAAKLQLKENDD